VEIGFTPRQVMQLTGVPYSTLNLWAKNGLVQPSVAPGTGTGSERVYSFSDLVALKVAFELRKSGVTTSSIKRVVEFLRENVPRNWAKYRSAITDNFRVISPMDFRVIA